MHKMHASPYHEPALTARLNHHAQNNRHLAQVAVKASKEEMDKNQVDLALRDACAHLLIPLNKCVHCRNTSHKSTAAAALLVGSHMDMTYPPCVFRCRRMTFFLPWKCEDERHGYEACQYAE